MDMKITRSSGNIFEDLGFDQAEAILLKLRSSLMLAIIGAMKKRQINQTQAAKLFGVTQPRISDLKRGKIDLFSLESLIGMLTRAGIPVAITVNGIVISADADTGNESIYPELTPTSGRRRGAADAPPPAGNRPV